MCRVLILDDDDELARLVASYLKRAGYQVNAFTEIGRATSAVRQSALRHEAYDILLIDQRLGAAQNGIQVMQEMLAACPEASAIIFTGFEDAEDGLQAYEAGAWRYLTKPFKQKELLYLLQTLQRERQDQREYNWQRAYSQMVEVAVQRPTFREVTRIVMVYTLQFGFQRTHLLWRPQGEDKDETDCLVGVISEGHRPPEGFANYLFRSAYGLPLADILATHDALFRRCPRPDPNWLGLPGFQSPDGEWVILPLWSGSALLGCLILDYDQTETHIHDHERRWLNVFARQVSVVLERASLFEHEQRLRAEKAVIGRIGQHINTRAALDNLETLLEEVRQQARALIDVSNFSVALTDEETRQIDFCLDYEDGQRQERTWLPIDEGLTGYLLRQRQTIHLHEEVKEFRERHNIRLYGRQAQSWLGVPLLVSDQVIGGIIVQDYTRPKAFTDRDERLLKEVADQVAGAIQINRLAQAEKKDAERMRVLQRAGVELLQIADQNEDHFWLTVLTIATANFGMRFNRALLFLAENNNRCLRGRLGVGADQYQDAHRDWEIDEQRGYDFETFLLELQTGAVRLTPFAEAVKELTIDLAAEKDNAFSQVLKTGQRQIVLKDEISTQLPSAFNRKFSFSESAVLPVRAGGATLGIVIIDNRHDGKPLQGRMLDRLETLLNNVGLVWESLRQRRKQEALLEANYAIMGEANRQPLAKTLTRICEAARRVMEADLTIIYPSKPGGNVYEFDKSNISYAGELRQPIKEFVKEKSRLKGIAAHVLRSGPLVIANIEQANLGIGQRGLAASSFVAREDVKALLGAPIRAPNTQESLGVFYIDYRAPRHFSDDDLQQAESFANLAAIAIFNHGHTLRERQNAGEIQQREHEATRRMLEQALASDREARVIPNLITNIQDTLGQAQRLTLVLRRWKSSSLTQEPLETYECLGVNSYNALEAVHLSPANRRRVRRTIETKTPFSNQTGTRAWVPITIGSSVIGVLAASAVEGQLPPQTLNILGRFAPVVFLALDNARRQEHLYAVLRAAKVVTEPTDLQATFRETRDSIRNVSPELSAMTLWYRDAETGKVRLGDTFGLRTPLPPQAEDDASKGERNAVQTVLNSPEPIWADDINQHPELIGRFTQDEGIRSVAAFPLRADDETVGAMFFNYRQPHYFSTEERTIFTILAEVVGASIRDSTRLETVRKEKERLDAANAIVETVATELNLENVLEKVLEKVSDLFKRPYLCVLLYNPDDHLLEFVPTTMKFYPIQNPENQQLRAIRVDGQSIASRTARQALNGEDLEPQYVPDVQADPNYWEVIPGIQSELCVSLMSKQGLLGVLVLERPRPLGFDSDEIELVKSIAHQISLAIERAHQSSQLSFKSTVAAMTGWASDLAHDINPYLGKIRSWAYLARESLDQPEAARQYIHHIEESAEYLRKAAPWQNLNPTPLPLDEFIRRAMQELTQTQGPELQLHLDLGCAGAQIMANTVTFRRVLRQLTYNAIHAMKHSQTRQLIIHTDLLPDNHVEIQFKDSGPGVDQKVRPFILQIPIPSTDKDRRGGLGLLLARQLVEDMHGTLRYTPQDGWPGAVFCIRLPILKVPAFPVISP